MRSNKIMERFFIVDEITGRETGEGVVWSDGQVSTMLGSDGLTRWCRNGFECRRLLESWGMAVRMLDISEDQDRHKGSLDIKVGVDAEELDAALAKVLATGTRLGDYTEQQRQLRLEQDRVTTLQSCLAHAEGQLKQAEKERAEALTMLTEEQEYFQQARTVIERLQDDKNDLLASISKKPAEPDRVGMSEGELTATLGRSDGGKTLVLTIVLNRGDYGGAGVVQMPIASIYRFLHPYFPELTPVSN